MQINYRLLFAENVRLKCVVRQKQLICEITHGNHREVELHFGCSCPFGNDVETTQYSHIWDKCHPIRIFQQLELSKALPEIQNNVVQFKVKVDRSDLIGDDQFFLLRNTSSPYLQKIITKYFRCK